MTQATAPKQAFTGWHMAMIMAVFFGVIIAVNVVLAVISVKSFTGLVVENSYVASQTWEKDTAVLAQDAQMDIHPKLSAAGGSVKLAFTTAAGDAVDVSSVALTLGHPVSASTDVPLTFQQTGKGTFEAAAALTGKNWEGEMTATLANGTQWKRIVRVDAE
ncbi:MAG: FixH family protein [Hyphomicrobiales bacterium]